MVVFFRNEFSDCDSLMGDNARKSATTPCGYNRPVQGLFTRRIIDMRYRRDFRSYSAKLVDSEKRSLSRSHGARPSFARRKIVTQPFSVIRLRPRAVVAINP